MKKVSVSSASRFFSTSIKGTFAASDEADHNIGGYAEGRRAFRSVEHAQPAAGAGAHVKHPAAALYGFNAVFDDLCDIRKMRFDRLRNQKRA